MIRFLGVVSLSLVFVFLLSCQTYTTGLQQSVARADEISAIAGLKTISTAQQTYAVSSGGSYGTFQQLSEAGYLDERFNSSEPQIKDYVFSMDVSANSYSVNADPARTGDQAGRHLYLDSTSPLIRVNPTQPATAKDPLMQP
jgi:hypothetical protein